MKRVKPVPSVGDSKVVEILHAHPRPTVVGSEMHEAPRSGHCTQPLGKHRKD